MRQINSRLLQNKAMNDNTYHLRRQVMSFIYEAKKLIDLPRIEVRVTNNHENILGVAYMGKNVIFISERAVLSRAVVFHEILHAVFSIDHVNDCPLMGMSIDLDNPLNDNECNRLFLMYANQKKKVKQYATI